MVKNTSTLATALLAAMLGGCATPVDISRNGLRIEPSSQVRHGVSPQGLYEIGRYLQAQERYREAAGAYRESIARAPDHAQVHNALGVVLSLLGNHDRAYASFAQALALTPEAPYLWSNLGYAYFLAGEGIAATAALTHGQELAPDDKTIRELLARSQEHFGADAPDGTSAMDLVATGPVQNEQPIQEAMITGSSENNVGAEAAVAEGVAAGWQLIHSPPLPLVSVGPAEYELQRASTARSSRETSAALPQNTAALEISNGNGLRGMAQRVSRTLKQQGLPTTRLTNQKGFGIHETELQYRVGYEAAAANLLSALPTGIRMRPTIHLRSDIKIRLVLGKDMANRLEALTQQVAGEPTLRTPPAKTS